MPVQRIFRIIRPWLACLLLALAACGRNTPAPAATRTPLATGTAAPAVTSSPAATASPAPQTTLPLITAENVRQLGQVVQWQQGVWNGAYAWTPDSRALLVSSFVTNGPRLIRLDADTHHEIWAGEAGTAFDISTDGRWIAEVSWKEISLLDAASGARVSSLSVDNCIRPTHVRFSPDGQRLAVTDGAEIYLLDRLNFTCRQTFKQIQMESITGFVRNLIFSPDGKTLLAVTDREIVLWATADGAEIKRLAGSYAAFDPGGRWLAVGSADGLSLYDGRTLQPARTLPEYQARSISFSPDGRLLVTASADGTSERLNFYSAETGALLAMYRGLPFGAYSVAFRPDGRQILVQGGSGGMGQPVLFLTLAVQGQPRAAAGEGAQAATTPWYQPSPLVEATQPPPLFPLLSTPFASQNGFPDPISTPAGGAPAYRLKAWSESDGLALVERMVEYAHAGDVYGPAGSRPGFTILQAPIRAAALEYLLRFPNSPHANSVRWRLALADAVAGRPDSDRWIVGQIEQGLNAGTIDPQDISSSLAPYGFVVNTRLCPAAATCSWGEDAAAGPLLVTDPFGDGGRAQVIQIQTVEAVTGSMLAVLHQDPAGRFYVVPVYSGWHTRYTERLQVAAQDLTGDGRPEIWVDENSHSGTMMAMTTYLYHWQGGSRPDQGRYVEVTDGQVSSSLDHFYQLKPGGDTGEPGIVSLINPQRGYSEKEIYRWNGAGFVLDERNVVFPLDIPNAFLGVLNRAMVDGQFAEIDALLQPPLDASSAAKIGPSAPDFIAFQRAVNAALAGDPTEAQNRLRALLAAPANANSRFISIVRAYQASYQQATDAYRACQAALAAYDRAIAPYQDSQGRVSPEKADEALGYAAHLDTAVCSLEAAFRQLVKGLDGTHPERLPARLAEYGVTIAWKTQLDANGDGKPDWLLRLDGADTADAWLLLSGAPAPRLVAVGSFFEAPAGVSFEILHLPGSDREAYLLQMGDRLKVFRVYPGEPGAALETLADDYGVTGYRVVSDGTSTDLLVNRSPKQYDPQQRKHWDAALGRFITYDALEEELLLRSQPGEVIRAVPEQLQLLKMNSQAHYYPWLEPTRLRYLLGLAYELSGDSGRAAQVYYELWRTHPDQPFAILAREKLELTRP